MMEKKRVAIYCRLSEEDRDKHLDTDDSMSIQNQKSMLLSHALKQGWEVYGIYSDELPGTSRTRPEFLKLIHDAENRKFDIVLCKTQSRFTRELELVEKYIHGLFPLWGIRFVSVVDNADTEIKGNKKSRQINGLVNEWYLEDLSDNIRSVLTDRRKKGAHIGAFALYGYMKDPDQKGHLIVDPEAAEVVREVFQMFAQGMGKTAIARVLNDRGIPNPTEYKRQKGLRYYQPKRSNSTLWKYFNISEMLINDMYIGNMTQGKYGSVSYKSKKNKPRPKNEWITVEGTHEPIIDRKLWDKVQELIQQKTKPCYTGEVGLFSRKVRCMCCGYGLSSQKNGPRHYLKCSTAYVSKGACVGAFISVSALEQIVLAELRRLSNMYLNMDELESKVHLNADLTLKLEQLDQHKRLYEKKIAEYVKGLREMYLDKVRGVLSESDYLYMSKDFSQEKNRIEKLVDETNQEIEKLKERLKKSEDRRQLLEKYVNLDHLDRVTVEILIDTILVGKKDPVSKEQKVEIYWNF
ncbi:MAG: recombinase family protein [Erysipelotrichaceae bacterium]|nr:recombinase family protein [Erysipelotrichaceae bacterium]